MKILVHNIYKTINIHGYGIQYTCIFFIFIVTKIECWPVFKQDPINGYSFLELELTPLFSLTSFLLLLLQFLRENDHKMTLKKYSSL